MTDQPDYHQNAPEPIAAWKISRTRAVLLVLSVIACLLVLVAGCTKTESSLLQQIHTKEYKDLTYIKPFTSLVGFNWKFCKDQHIKAQHIKAPKLALPFLHW